MMMHLARVGVVIAAVASSANLFITVTSDAQTGYDDLQSAVHRIETRQIQPCR